jgi:mono/diheme cytochrome c family protein
MRIKPAATALPDNRAGLVTKEPPMSTRLGFAALLLPLAAFAADDGDGKKIFDAKCSQCHSFEMARGMLAPKPPAQRPAYLAEFLKTHPPKLTDAEKPVVIEALSRP